jgi:threonylcarbamoyladenosine tRNA methylthiotransferase MtaB
MPTVSLYTLGCKLNFTETSALGREFTRRGFDIVEFGTPADVCLINTCSVTERAERQCRQVVRRALRTSIEPYIIVTGCYAQLRPDAIARIPGVDLVLGAREKFSLFEYAGDLEKGLYPHVAVSDVSTVGSFGSASTAVGDRTRAYLKVQDGCDFHCSFCTIPRARGESMSQSIGASVEQARGLVAEGFKEITLTGVNVGDFGKKSQTTLLTLLQHLAAVEGLERMRVSSIEPNLLTDELISFVAEHPKACKHFHIPLQSGSDDMLRAMRRRYTTRQYAELIHTIRQRMPDCGIGVDVITGFPGESVAHFEETYRFVKSLPISYLHVFTYSERPDTPAASLPGRVEPNVRFKRSGTLRLLGGRKKKEFYGNMRGRVVDVLLENDVDGGCRLGFTDNYVRVAVPEGGTTANMLVHVEINAAGEEVCRGRILASEIAA